MTKTVRRLSGLEIDEVSLVDRPANQHGLVAITKRDEGPMTKLFDAAGNEVDEDSLQVGDFVYDEEGREFQALSEQDMAELEADARGGMVVDEDQYAANELTDDEPSPLRELAEVGKAGAGSAMPGLIEGGRTRATRFLTNPHVGRATEAASRAGARGAEVGAQARGAMSRNPGRTLAGGVATGYVAGRTRKSLGTEVLEELSKALTDDDRDQVLSKAMDRIDTAQQEAEQATSIAKALQERAEHGQYVELAKSYELPVEDDYLGGILQKVAKALNPDELDTLDRILNVASDALVPEEAGSAGYEPSFVMGEVQGHVRGLVGKADMTQEQATVALFEANPEAYDAYLNEKG